MLSANIEAQIEAKQATLKQVEDDLLRMDKLLESYKKIRNSLLSERSDLIWKIEELKEELENA